MQKLSHTALAAALLALAGSASSAQAADFPTVVRQILEAQTDGPLSEMGPAKRQAMTECVVASLSPLPNGKKRFIVEGANFDEQEHRFGQVVDEDNAKWRQNIAKACSEIAVKDESEFSG